MSNFQMTWKQMTPAVNSARRRALRQSVALPTPRDDTRMSIRDMQIRSAEHRRFMEALAALPGPGKREEAA